jgi:type II secretory pathway pseudopilin PulG
LTLVELLVALAVISVLAGIALPAVKNTLKGQRINRAASLLQSAIQEGRARAIASGGGGVIIDRIGDETIQERSQSIRIRMADAPLPYTGDTAAATAKYQFIADGSSAGTGAAQIQNPAGPRGALPPLPSPAPTQPFRDHHVLLFDGSLQPQILRSARDIANGALPTLINPQDVIRIGNAGLPMRIERLVELTASTAPPWAFWTTSEPMPILYPTNYVMVEVVPQEVNTDLRLYSGSDISFSISKSPRPAIAMPVEMPKGTAIDLTVSGIGRFGNEFSPMFVDGNYLTTTAAPFTSGTLDYHSIYILFGSRGEVSRVVSAALVSGVPQLVEYPVTGDVHLLVGQAGETKTEPEEQLEDNDPNPLGDEAKNGTTPLLHAESIWVTIRARNGEVLSSPWIDPTDPTDPATQLIPPVVGVPTDASHQARIRTVIGRTRTAAVDSRDGGIQ